MRLLLLPLLTLPLAYGAVSTEPAAAPQKGVKVVRPATVAVNPYNGKVVGVKNVQTQVLPHGGTVTTTTVTKVNPPHNTIVVPRGPVVLHPEGGLVVGQKRPVVIVPNKPAVVVHHPTDFGLGKTTFVSGKHLTYHVPTKTLVSHATYVRTHFNHYNTFTPVWYKTHTLAWRPLRWLPGRFWYRHTWPTLSVFINFNRPPVYIDYGTSLVYQNNTVYYQGDPIATAPVYAQQAAQLAAFGRNAKVDPNGDWEPLGVFAMVQSTENDPNLILQPAINKMGIIRGNLVNALTNTNSPIFGAVDPKTQHRVAWTVGDGTDPVYETTLANFTQDQATMLVHFGADRTQQWILVRMPPPN